MTTRRGEAAALAGLLAVAGVTHFVRPGFYDPIVPRALPGPARFWTYASGVAELAVAAAVAHPATRRTGGLAAAGHNPPVMAKPGRGQHRPALLS